MNIQKFKKNMDWLKYYEFELLDSNSYKIDTKENCVVYGKGNIRIYLFPNSNKVEGDISFTSNVRDNRPTVECLVDKLIRMAPYESRITEPNAGELRKSFITGCYHI